MGSPKLLVSVWWPEEVRDALEGGADIIDIKNPKRGSLGAPSLRVVSEISRNYGGVVELSAAVGDITCCPEMAALAAYTLSKLGMNYVKVGLQVNDEKLGLEIVKEVSETVGSLSKVIIVGYADYIRIKTLSPMKIIDLAYKGGAYGVMIDTRIKDGLTTLDFLSTHYLKEFVNRAKKLGLLKALAGGLKRNQVKHVVNLGFDVIGFRTAACNNGRLGRVSKAKVHELKTALQRE